MATTESGTDGPPPAGGPSVWGFAKSELVGALRTTWRGIWRSWLAVTLLVALWLSLGGTVAEAWARGGIADASLAVLVALGVGAYVGFFPALGVGAAALAWRLFGWATVFVAVVAPLAFMGVFWLTRGWLVSLASDLAMAYVDAFAARGLPVTELAAAELAGGLKVAHAGPLALPLLVIALLPLIPALLADLVLIGLDGTVLWELAQLGLGLALVFALAAALTLLLCAPPLVIALVVRARRRWRAFAAQRAAGA